MTDWPPRDDIARILLDLYELKIVEYHCDEHDQERGRVHRITTAHGYEVALSEDEVMVFALGAHTAHFNQTAQSPPSAEAVDARIAERREAVKGH